MTDLQKLTERDGVLVVDVQNDFCPGGALAVPDGDRVVPELNRWLRLAASSPATVIASRDWHTVDHCSFQAQGGPWPEHCIQDTAGAAFHDDLALPETTVRVSKGTAFDGDAYSAFDGTGLAGFLHNRGIERLWIGGLAADVCVLATVEDACRLDFETHLIVPATRPVDPDQFSQVLERMDDAGAILEQR